jgi:hypothetical protein
MNFVGTTFGGNAVYLCPVCGDKRFFYSSLFSSVVETDSRVCFVACAVYGSSDLPQVVALRAFRDRVLVRHPAGRVFVWWYYRIFGPAAATLIKLSGSTGRELVRRALDRLVTKIKRDYDI